MWPFFTFQCSVIKFSSTYYNIKLQSPGWKNVKSESYAELNRHKEYSIINYIIVLKKNEKSTETQQQNIIIELNKNKTKMKIYNKRKVHFHWAKLNFRKIEWLQRIFQLRVEEWNRIYRIINYSYWSASVDSNWFVIWRALWIVRTISWFHLKVLHGKNNVEIVWKMC